MKRSEVAGQGVQEPPAEGGGIDRGKTVEAGLDGLEELEEPTRFDQAAVEAFFARERPAYVFLAAAKVGGIRANDTYPADFIRENLQIQTRKGMKAIRKITEEPIMS